MESTKTSKGILIASLLVFGVGLTSIDLYQDHVIQKQRYELQWLVAHATIRPETIVADLKKEGKIPANAALSSPSKSQAPAASSTPADKPAAAAASAPPAAQVAPALKP